MHRREEEPAERGYEIHTPNPPGASLRPVTAILSAVAFGARPPTGLLTPLPCAGPLRLEPARTVERFAFAWDMVAEAGLEPTTFWL